MRMQPRMESKVALGLRTLSDMKKEPTAATTERSMVKKLCVRSYALKK
jgi:hypothetical protein